MLNKLHINADRWNTPADQARYAINRVGGDSEKGAISHITAYRLSDSDYFKTPDMVFEVLRGVYEDKNPKNNSRRSYTGLKQKSSDSFAMFFSEFRKLGSILRNIDEMLIEDLKDKVLSRLRDALIINRFSTPPSAP